MSDAAASMDAIYRFQRHVYDATRKPYLLGRDRMIAELAAPDGGHVLEIGCGTARNLLKIAQHYPRAQCYGLDASALMLEKAAASIAQSRHGARVRIAQGDATAFDPASLFGVASFERIVISYCLSMIPAWTDVLASALERLPPDGSLHVVDFGDLSRVPAGFRTALLAWLRRFSVTPRTDLAATLDGLARAHGRAARVRQILGGYALVAEIGPARG